MKGTGRAALPRRPPREAVRGGRGGAVTYSASPWRPRRARPALRFLPVPSPPLSVWKQGEASPAKPPPPRSGAVSRRGEGCRAPAGHRQRARRGREAPWGAGQVCAEGRGARAAVRWCPTAAPSWGGGDGGEGEAPVGLGRLLGASPSPAFLKALWAFCLLFYIYIYVVLCY